MKRRHIGFIVMFGNDFVHEIYETWKDAAHAIIANGHGYWDGNYLMFHQGWDVEQITIH